MKAVYGYDITNKSEYVHLDGIRFVVRELDEERKRLRREQHAVMKGIEKRMSPNPVLRILKSVLGIIVVILVVSLFRAILESGFKTLPILVRSHPGRILLAVELVCPALWIFLHLSERKKVRECQEDINTQHQVSKMNSLIEDAFRYLQVPGDAIDIEVFLYAYKNKKDTDSLNYRTNRNFENRLQRMFIEDDVLYISDNVSVIALSLSALVSYESVPRRVQVAELKHSEEPDRKYRVYRNNGLYIIPSYLRMVFHMDGESYEMLLPSYEEDRIRKLIGREPAGMSAEQAAKKSGFRTVAIAIACFILIIAAFLLLWLAAGGRSV